MLKSAAFLVVAALTATALSTEGAIAQTATGSATSTAAAGSSTTILNPAGLPITRDVNLSTITENGLRTTTTTTTVTEPAGDSTAPAVGNPTPVVLPGQLPTIVRPIGSPLRTIVLPTGFPTLVVPQSGQN